MHWKRGSWIWGGPRESEARAPEWKRKSVKARSALNGFRVTFEASIVHHPPSVPSDTHLNTRFRVPSCGMILSVRLFHELRCDQWWNPATDLVRTPVCPRPLRAVKRHGGVSSSKGKNGHRTVFSSFWIRVCVGIGRN